MSMSVSSIGGYGAAMMNQGMRPPRPNTSEIADTLFSRLDTGNQGYLEVGDLESALAKTGGATSSTASDVFGQLDTNADGKVTKEEFSSGLKALEEELNSQLDAMRMGGARSMANMPPPPPASGKEQGFTQDELSAISESTSDSRLSALMSELASNFDAADANGDGRVTAEEAVAFQASNQSVSSTDKQASTGLGSTTSASSNAEALFRTIMQLMRAYSSADQEASTTTAFSVAA